MDKIALGYMSTFFLFGLVVGGIRGAAKAKKPIRDVFVYALSCGVTSLAVGLFFLNNGMAFDKPYLSLLFAVLAAWVGPSLLDKFVEVARKKLGEDIKEDKS